MLHRQKWVGAASFPLKSGSLPFLGCLSLLKEVLLCISGLVVYVWGRTTDCKGIEQPPGSTPARAQEPEHFSVATHCVGSIWHFSSSLLGTDGSAPIPSDNTSTTFCLSCSFTDLKRKWRQQRGPGICLPTPWGWDGGSLVWSLDIWSTWNNSVLWHLGSCLGELFLFKRKRLFFFFFGLF